MVEALQTNWWVEMGGFIHQADPHPLASRGWSWRRHAKDRSVELDPNGRIAFRAEKACFWVSDFDE